MDRPIWESFILAENPQCIMQGEGRCIYLISVTIQTQRCGQEFDYHFADLVYDVMKLCIVNAMRLRYTSVTHRSIRTKFLYVQKECSIVLGLSFPSVESIGLIPMLIWRSTAASITINGQFRWIFGSTIANFRGCVYIEKRTQDTPRS